MASALAKSFSFLAAFRSPHTTAKNASPGDYRKATGFEAVLGWLYLKNEMERVLELVRILLFCLPLHRQHRSVLTAVLYKKLVYGFSDQLDLKGPVGLVIGNEGEGVGRLVKEKCDMVASIPMRGHPG
mgnify:CR=1 FL=1